MQRQKQETGPSSQKPVVSKSRFWTLPKPPTVPIVLHLVDVDRAYVQNLPSKWLCGTAQREFQARVHPSLTLLHARSPPQHDFFQTPTGFYLSLSTWIPYTCRSRLLPNLNSNEASVPHVAMGGLGSQLDLRWHPGSVSCTSLLQLQDVSVSRSLKHGL